MENLDKRHPSYLHHKSVLSSNFIFKLKSEIKMQNDAGLLGDLYIPRKWFGNFYIVSQGNFCETYIRLDFILIF